MYRGLSTLRIKQFKSVSCFRIVSSSIHRDALHACAARPNRAALCVYRAARCGERIERRRWRMKRDERVAAVKILSVRRKAAQKFWAPQQGHRALRISIAKRCVGDDAYIVPPPPRFLCRGIPLILFILSHFSKNATLNARIIIIYCVNPVTGLDNAEQLNIIPIIGNNDYVHRSV